MFWFFTMFSIALMMAITANSLLDEPLNTQFEVRSAVSFEVDTPKITYFRGSLSSDEPLKNVRVVDEKGEVIKQFLAQGEKECEIYWFATKASQYQLQISPFDDHASNVSLNLATLPLKEDQRVSPSLPLLSPLLSETQNKIKSGIKNAEENFWQQVEKQGTPLVEPAGEKTRLLTFLWRGDESNVRLLGAPYEGHAHLARLPNSAIWYKSYVVSDKTILSYRLAPNVPQLVVEEKPDRRMEQRRAVLATVQPDPLNRQPLFAENDGRFGAASTITLPQAPSDVVTRDVGNPRGTISHEIYHSVQLDNERRISFYLPNKRYNLTPESPLLILFDGDAYLDRVPTPIVLDNLIAQQKIPPLRAVFINNPLPSLRAQELTPNETFADFMAHEFKPYLCKEHRICPSAQDTILSGSSFGGLASMAIAFRYPEVFGTVLSQSGSFWWREENSNNQWMIEQITRSSRKDISIYLNAGAFEKVSDERGILETNHRLFEELQRKGYPVIFQTFSSGHDYFAWRIGLAHGLTQLFTSKP